MKKLRIFSAITIICLFVIGCATSRRAQEDDIKGSLPKLTSAVESTIRYSDSTQVISDARLLKMAMKDKRELRAVFKGVPILVQHDSKHVVLMVCTKDRKASLFEDSSWTINVDRDWRTNNPPHAPTFTLSPSAIPD